MWHLLELLWRKGWVNVSTVVFLFIRGDKTMCSATPQGNIIRKYAVHGVQRHSLTGTTMLLREAFEAKWTIWSHHNSANRWYIISLNTKMSKQQACVCFPPKTLMVTMKRVWNKRACNVHVDPSSPIAHPCLHYYKPSEYQKSKQVLSSYHIKTQWCSSLTEQDDRQHTLHGAGAYNMMWVPALSSTGIPVQRIGTGIVLRAIGRR